MKKILRLILAFIVVAGLSGISGCTEDHQERFEEPPWLGGSSIEILQERGKYNIFLSLMEKANYYEPVSKQLFTLFVPSDSAFNAYFKSVGINSVDDLTKEEAVEIFTLHVLRNPLSRFQLVYEYAWNELQGPKGEYASLYHRKLTSSTTIPYSEKINYLPGRIGETVLVYTDNKYVPLWTAEWFNDYGGAEDGSDYLFMYPRSTWRKGYTSNLKGMNWHSAMVIPNPEIPDELEVRTASGFIYFLDRVVPPMPTIDQYLKDNPQKFGLYYDILQRFATYPSTRVDEQKRVLYKKSYDLISDLALERGPSTDPAVPPQNMWTAFVPTNDVLQTYLDNTVLKYYSSIDRAPRVTLYYILQTQLSANVALLSKMEKSYFNFFGDDTEVSRADVADSYVCSNGVVYESKRVLEPNVFTCVPGELFINKDYSTLLFVLDKAGMLSSLANPESNVTLFAATNEKLEEYGIRYNATNDVIENRGPVDGIWRTMNTLELETFAQDQIHKGLLTDLGGPGGFAEMLSQNYIYYGGNQVYAAENQATNAIANVQEVIRNERNGFLVKVDKPIESRVVMGRVLSGQFSNSVDFSDPDLSEFSKLLVSANMLDARFRDATTKENIPNLKFLAAYKKWTAFIPTNEAMAKARAEGIIPPGWPKTTTGRDSVNNFLKYHFVINNVIFDDGKASGIFDTYFTYKDPLDATKTLNAKIEIMNSPNNLSIKDNSGQIVQVDHANANILVRKGVIHKINTVLNFYN